MNNSLSNSSSITEIVNKGLKKRYRSEFMFRLYGITSILFAAAFLIVFFSSIIDKGYSAFTQGELNISIYLDPEIIDPDNTRDEEEIRYANYDKLVFESLKNFFPSVSSRKERKELKALVSNGTSLRIQSLVLDDMSLIGKTLDLSVKLDSDIDMFLKGNIDISLDESQRKISDNQVKWTNELKTKGLISQKFNSTLFSAGDSREPEQAGVLGALIGSFFMLLITFIVAFPLGVAAAIYLEEFAPKNRFTDFVEVNINNLAAVPSIIYGLLGLAVFINFFGMPRSAPLVGGLVLALMTFPVIIIASRAALQSVPPSITDAALGVGASKIQTIFDHVFPLALPGMLTGSIIGMARALGESAPLLMIGMVAFVVDIPGTPLDASAALPVQVYLWADAPERGFVERTSAAILVLLFFLLVMNSTAIWLRNKFEIKW
ncbi:MAG: phosphate ABC transporter permease PtsA [Gammaproteobacteria bacterium]|nr:MAG: phosphate ABC transporter permease PtsA [Gammaproteobacteria bacterium]|tara:strand:- start:1027 stop:2325 length:1299 start_codon:yes stop_codon:yes gene_type:complete